LFKGALMKFPLILGMTWLVLVLGGCRQPMEETPQLHQAQQDETSQALETMPALVPFQENERWGYAENGQTLIPARYDMADPFSPDGIARVLDDQGWAIINQKGEILLRPFIYDNGPDEFQDGLARFVANNKMGYFSPSGEIVIQAQFQFAWPFENGKARVCMDCEKVSDGEHYQITGGTQWFIDRNGEKLSEPDK